MNKNLFKTFAIAAMTVLAGACAKEQVGSADGETVEMTFNVDVPETTITTKGLSDSKDVNEVICQVFLSSNHTLLESKTVDFVDGKAKVSFSLVNGQKYDFAFWAQVRGTGYYDTSNLSAVKIDYSKAKANDAERVAFFCVQTKKQASATTGEATLKRAFAQVNFGGILDTTRPDAIKGVSQSKITMTNLASTIDLFKAKTKAGYSGNVEKVTFATNTVISDEKLIVNAVEYQYFATAYVPAPFETKMLTDAVATLTLDNGRTLDVKAPNAPIKQNYKTNILGNFFNDVEYGWTITIDDKFSDEPGFIYDPATDGLAKGATVTLSEDYKVSKGNWKGINIPVGTESVLNLNGHRFANEDNGYTADAKSALVVKGKLTINGDGEVYCEGNTERKPDVEKQPSNTCISVLEGGHLIINGGNYSVGTDVDNKCNSTIYVENVGKAGKVEIYGGTFTNAQGSNGHSYVLNQDDELTEKCITVYGGTFIGFNPADNTSDGEHTNYVAIGYKSVKISESPETWKVVDASVSVADQAEFEKTLSDLSGTDDVIIKLGTGNFEFKKSGYAGNITLKGAGIGKTVVTSNTYYENNGVTISLENLTFDSKNPYVGDAQLCQFLRSDIAFTNCEINGVVGVMAPKSATFTGCTFKNPTNSGFTGYSIIYYGYDNSTVTVDDCKFETTGKAICLYGTAGIYNLVVKDCEFLTSNKDKAAIQIHTDYTNGDAASTLMRGNVNITNTTVSGFNGIWWEGLNDKTPKVPTKYFTITIDGTTVQTAE